MSSSDKDIIYVDIDDEITGIIDKVQASGKKIVALVLPKRSTVFQSIVNMKLLKSSAEEAKRHVVLITSESSLMPLAGSVGLYVAKTLQTKPEIPASPDANELVEMPDEAVPLDNTEGDKDFDPEKEATKPVGELATKTAAEAPESVRGIETLELDNEPEKAVVTPAEAASKAKPKKAAKGNKGLKVPDFFKFRKRLIIGAAIIILLIILWILGFKVLPKASIDVKTNAEAINSSMNITLDTNADSLDPSSLVAPAQTEQEQKTNTQTAPATGQENKGNKASGSVTMTAQKCGGNPFDTPGSVPAGTGVSVNGQTYITQNSVSFSGSGASGGCYTYSGGSTPIVAQRPGANYNTGNTNFNVNGRSDVDASGSASGGSDNIVKVVQQSDINTARQKLESQDSNEVKQDLENRLKQDNLFAITATFNTGSPKVTTSANAGDTADNVTVTENITYTMYGAKESDLKKLIDNDIKSQIDTSKQAILDEGLDSATFKVISSNSTSEQVSMDATATAGPDIDLNALKEKVAGKKSGDIKSIIENNPGVTGVDVHFSPFWVSKAPNNTGKIDITFAKPEAPAN